MKYYTITLCLGDSTLEYKVQADSKKDAIDIAYSEIPEDIDAKSYVVLKTNLHLKRKK